MDKDAQYEIVTEVGVFGSINIDDPSRKKIESKDSLDELITEATNANRQNLKR